MHRGVASRFALIAAVLLLTADHRVTIAAGHPEAIEVAQADGAVPRPLEPRYQPVPPPEKSWYNDTYIFSATRGVADSTMVPVAKALLYPLTIPLDLVLLPFTAIGGLFL